MAYTNDGRAMCDRKGCRRLAKVNYQTGTARYSITGNEVYDFDSFDDDGMVNEFWCKEHDTLA